jgi:hypothetical protein
LVDLTPSCPSKAIQNANNVEVLHPPAERRKAAGRVSSSAQGRGLSLDDVSSMNRARIAVAAARFSLSKEFRSVYWISIGARA